MDIYVKRFVQMRKELFLWGYLKVTKIATILLHFNSELFC